MNIPLTWKINLFDVTLLMRMVQRVFS